MATTAAAATVDIENRNNKSETVSGLLLLLLEWTIDSRQQAFSDGWIDSVL